MINLFKTIKTPNQGVAARLLFSIVIFSSIVTFTATAIQFYTDYHRDIRTIEKRLNEIETSYLDSISASLWNLDIQQLQLQLEGILRFPDIISVTLLETDPTLEKPLKIALGQHTQETGLNRTFTIFHQQNGQDIQIGGLQIATTLEEVYDRLFDRALVILLSQGIKTFLVSMFILYLVHRLINRHLARISSHLEELDFTKPIKDLTLERVINQQPDELDHVVDAFNNMSHSLKSTYIKLEDSNRALQADITARQKAEEEVRRLNLELEDRVLQRTSELEAANGELSSFCYSVSHDLRAPLRRIEGFRRILQDRYSQYFDDKGQHYLNRIEVGTQEMNEMIDSFLKLSRSTNITLTVEEINLTEMASKIWNRIIEKSEERKIIFLTPKTTLVNADRRLLDIMLTNLLENAWKYTKLTDKPVVELGLEEQDDTTAYYIRDNGAGFDMSSTQDLLKPFTRLHTNEEFDGVGIGLATVNRIIARHGGKLWFDASPNQGATFYFTLSHLTSSHLTSSHLTSNQ